MANNPKYSPNSPKTPVAIMGRHLNSKKQDQIQYDSWDECGFNGSFCGKVAIPKPRLPVAQTAVGFSRSRKTTWLGCVHGVKTIPAILSVRHT